MSVARWRTESSGQVLSWGTNEGHLSLFQVSTVAALARDAAGFRSGAGINAALDLTDVQLALLFSLMELTDGAGAGPEGTGPRFVDSDAVLSDARTLFGLGGDYIAELEQLRARGLVHVAANDRASIMTTTFPSNECLALVLGRQVHRFGRMPLVRLATTIFDVALRPVLGPFEYATYGIGDPSLGQMQSVLNMVPREVIKLPSPPSVLARGIWGRRRVYFAVEFPDESARDHAARSLRGLTRELWGETLALSVVEPTPGSPCPDERFVSAAAAIARVSSTSWSSNFAPEMPTAMPPLMAAEIRCAMREHIRTRASYRELLAAGMEEARSFAVHEASDRNYVVIEYEGVGAGVSEMLEVDPSLFSDPLFTIRAGQKLKLPVNASVRRMTTAFGHQYKDPAVEIALQYREAVRTFNRHQGREFVDVLDLEATGARLSQAHEAAHSEALSLYDANIPVMGDRHRPVPMSVYAILLPSKGRHSDLPRYTIAYLAQPSEAPSFAYETRLDLDGESLRGVGEIVASTFGLKNTERMNQGWGAAATSIGHWLGFDSSAISVVDLDFVGQRLN